MGSWELINCLEILGQFEAANLKGPALRIDSFCEERVPTFRSVVCLKAIRKYERARCFYSVEN